MENILFAAEDLFGHVLESENGVLLISCFDGTFADIKKRYMTVLGEERNGYVIFINERMNLDLGEAVADFYLRSGATTNYTPLNRDKIASNINISTAKELIRVPSNRNENVINLTFAVNDRQ
ncbi:hypothetical protein [Alteromonas gracilis]|uniref:hypothetical protein n=1 Tax=Alteromonas gracilis TaxID=1479524 RepID=UPI003734E6B5